MRHTGKIKALKIHKVSPQSVGCTVHFKVPPWEEKKQQSCALGCVPIVAAVNIFVPVSRAEALVESVSGGGGAMHPKEP